MAVFEGIKVPSTGNFDADFARLLDRVETDPKFREDITSEHAGNPITLGSRVADPSTWAGKQVKNAAAAAETWLQNVLKPRKEPIKAALAAAGKRENKVREALDQKKWDKAMAKVDEASMYATISKRGAAAYRSGVTDREDKVKARVEELQPMVTALALQIDAMPQDTDAQREARMLAARKGMIAIGKKRRGIS
jgi:hypothetical protein